MELNLLHFSLSHFDRGAVFPIYRESLKGSSQVVRICGGKIVLSCLQEVNITQLSHLNSHNLGRAI